MMKVLLLMSLFGLSFSVLAKGFSGCDLEMSEEKVFVANAKCYCEEATAISRAKDNALDVCQKAGYSNCRVKSYFSEKTDDDDYTYHYTSATVVGEKREELSYEDRKASLCSKINKCILNSSEKFLDKKLDRLRVLFEMNEC